MLYHSTHKSRMQLIYKSKYSQLGVLGMVLNDLEAVHLQKCHQYILIKSFNLIPPSMACYTLGKKNKISPLNSSRLPLNDSK